MEVETNWPNKNNGWKIHAFFVGFITAAKNIPNFCSKESEMNFAWHRRILVVIGRGIWKKIVPESVSEFFLEKFTERICSNSTCRLNATQSPEKVAESQYN